MKDENGFLEGHQTEIGDCRVAFATEKKRISL